MVSIPPILVVIACKVMIAEPSDQNAQWTHVENNTWAIENSMMVCRREEVQLYDPVEGMKLHPSDNPASPLNPNLAMAGQCARAGVMLAKEWDDAHHATPYRVWRIGCPAPIVDGRTGAIIGYKLPECGHRETVICVVDSTT